MNYRPHHDRLAAEYVLGTLHGRARRRFEQLLVADQELKQAVRRWESYLMPLAMQINSIKPPDRVWRAIQNRLFSSPVNERLVFWRRFALASGVMALVLTILLLAPREPGFEPGHLALLADQQAKPIIAVSVARDSRSLQIRALATITLHADQALELWAVPTDGKPQSLGLIAGHGTTELKLKPALQARLASITAMAVSLEPAGGSPTGSATGPVLYQGALQRW